MKFATSLLLVAAASGLKLDQKIATKVHQDGTTAAAGTNADATNAAGENEPNPEQQAIDLILACDAVHGNENHELSLNEAEKCFQDPQWVQNNVPTEWQAHAQHIYNAYVKTTFEHINQGDASKEFGPAELIQAGKDLHENEGGDNNDNADGSDQGENKQEGPDPVEIILACDAQHGNSNGNLGLQEAQACMSDPAFLQQFNIPAATAGHIQGMLEHLFAFLAKHDPNTTGEYCPGQIMQAAHQMEKEGGNSGDEGSADEGSDGEGEGEMNPIEAVLFCDSLHNGNNLITFKELKQCMAGKKNDEIAQEFRQTLGKSRKELRMILRQYVKPALKATGKGWRKKEFSPEELMQAIMAYAQKQQGGDNTNQGEDSNTNENGGQKPSPVDVILACDLQHGNGNEEISFQEVSVCLHNPDFVQQWIPDLAAHANNAEVIDMILNQHIKPAFEKLDTNLDAEHTPIEILSGEKQ